MTGSAEKTGTQEVYHLAPLGQKTTSLRSVSLLPSGIMLAIFVCFPQWIGWAAEAPPLRPNVILILADDLGWRDVGCYGSSFHDTPNIDQLAARGMRFTQAYAANPLCSPTRASILTGLYPARIGITAPVCHLSEEVLEKGLQPRRPGQTVRVARSLTRLRPEYLTLAEILSSAGYVTAHFGKWHLGHSGPYEPKDQGFRFDWPHTPQAAGPGGGYLAPWRFIRDPNIQGEAGEHIEDRMAKEAASFIRQHRNQPFFLNYWCYSVHSPWTAKPELVEYFARKADPQANQRNPVYAAMVKSLDDAVGTLLRAIDEAGITDRTIIVFFSDNGGYAYLPRSQTQPPGYESIPATSNAPLRSGKASIYEGGTRVPCIVVWPGKVRPGSTSNALLSSVDLFPTILEMCGIPLPEHPLDGLSQVPALLGKGQPRQFVFCHFPHGGANRDNRIDGFLPSAYIREGDWKLIRFFAAGPNGEDRFELYNLREDIGETRDRSGEEPERVQQLAEKLNTLLQQTEAVIPVFQPATLPTPNPKDPLLGWKPRGCEAEVRDGRLLIRSTSASPFLGYALGQIRGPVQVRLEIRVDQGEKGRIEWLPPPDRQSHRQEFRVIRDGFQTVAVEVPWDKPVGIIRIYLPSGSKLAEISWIEISAPSGVRRFEFR
jgi:arylsulfatase A-like enzyme